MTIFKAIEKVCQKEPLFTNMVTRLKPVEDNDNCPTLGTDGENLYYNSDYLKTLTEREMCGVVLHEVFHCAFQHQWRRGNRDQTLWNIATDYAINTVVVDSFPLPQGALLDMKYAGMSAEQIYDSFPKQNQKKQKGKGSGEGDGEQQQGWCDKSSWGKGKQPKKKSGGGNIFDKLFGNDDDDKSEGKSEGQKEAEWKRLYEKTFLNNYGKLPQSLQRVLAKMHYVPVVDWASLVGQLLSEDTTDYTFSRPDRRFMEHDYFIPSMHSMDKLKDVVFAYDTSGSISEEDLRAFYVETINLFENFPSLQGWTAVCDADLHSFNQVHPQQGYDDFQFMGGGGTDFRPVFEEIERRGIRPKGLFYFTDTEGSFPSTPPAYPVFWLVRTRIDGKYSVHVPFGEVIRFLEK